MEEIRTSSVLESVLLQVLSKFPEGIDIKKAYADIERNYSFPQDWMKEIPASTGYDELESRGLNWRDIPQEDLVQIVPTEPMWKNKVRWARNGLRESGYLDTSVPRGVWKLTDKGKSAANQTLEGLTDKEKEIATPKNESFNEKLPDEEHGPSSREQLQKKLELLTSSMPIEDLELVVDIARSVRLRSRET